MIVFAKPICCYDPTAKMKMLVDRIRPFIKNKKLRRNQAVGVSPSTEDPVACDTLLDMFRWMFLYLKMDFLGKILVKAYDKGEIAKNKEEVASKYAFCTSLRHYVP